MNEGIRKRLRWIPMYEELADAGVVCLRYGRHNPLIMVVDVDKAVGDGNVCLNTSDGNDGVQHHQRRHAAKANSRAQAKF